MPDSFNDSSKPSFIIFTFERIFWTDHIVTNANVCNTSDNKLCDNYVCTSGNVYNFVKVSTHMALGERQIISASRIDCTIIPSS